jgi:signal peptidase I
VQAQRPRILAGFVLAGILAFLLVLFAPSQIGGSSAYTTTEGISMEPLFHKGDLAISRPASSYKVGDIVLYESPVFHRPVLHRILVIQHGRYFFKGDNNDFVDPGWVTRDQLLGKLWIRAPGAGRILSWLGTPSHSAAIAGLAMLMLVLGGSSGTARRRRRGRRRGAWKRPPVRHTFARHLHRPRKTPENIAAGFLVLLAIVLLVVGFTHPVKKPAQIRGAYSNSGAFSYKAHVTRPVSSYPTGVAHAGEPLFLEYFKTLDLGFTYRFASRLRHDVHGTIGLSAVMSSDSSWHRAFQLVKPRGFTGDRATVDGALDLQELRTLMLEVATASGAVGANYTIELQPVVKLRGTVGKKKLNETFSPTLPMSMTQSTLNVEASTPTTLPGAAYTQPSPGAALEAALHPARAGSVGGVEPVSVAFAHARLAVATMRGLGLGLLALAILILFTKPLKRRRREVWSHERRIAHRYDCVIVDVVSIADGAVATAPPTQIPDFESLATLARYCERPILRETREGAESYAVEDGGRLYVYRVTRPLPPEPVVAEDAAPVPPPALTAPIRQRRRVPSLVRFGLPLLLLFAALASAVAFTGGNTVPASYAGVSTQPVDLNQLAPTQCSGINLTNQIVMTTNSTAGTGASDLIVGRNVATTVTISGGGQDDCLVGGGGAGTTNKFDGGPGTHDVCIGAPGATNTFKNCETTG